MRRYISCICLDYLGGVDKKEIKPQGWLFQRSVRAQDNYLSSVCSMWVKTPRRLFCNTRMMLHLQGECKWQDCSYLGRRCYYYRVRDISGKIILARPRSFRISSKLIINNSLPLWTDQSDKHYQGLAVIEATLMFGVIRLSAKCIT